MASIKTRALVYPQQLFMQVLWSKSRGFGWRCLVCKKETLPSLYTSKMLPSYRRGFLGHFRAKHSDHDQLKGFRMSRLPFTIPDPRLVPGYREKFVTLHGKRIPPLPSLDDYDHEAY